VTRLLPHEVKSIRAGGLKLTTEDLVYDRVSEAFDHGLIDESLRDTLLAGNVFAEKEADNRNHQVWLTLSRRPFDYTPHGFGFYPPSGGGLSYLGRRSRRPTSATANGPPAVVVADIRLNAGWQTHAVYPSLHKLFVGRLLELEELGADVFYSGAVPAEHIIDIWQPQQPEYGWHPDLSQA
jgi:hypothetical protein